MSDVSARAAALRAQFEAAGASLVETPVLQPAAALLDLYGEDIRARAYVTSDALRGEQMLRPDFTVPVVQMHMSGGAEPARYTYAGTVFRRQEEDDSRPNEYMQVGYEVFDRTEPEAADAEVFALIRLGLGRARVRAATGDIGLLKSAVEGLQISNARKAALLRHIWRPKRFRALLERFSGQISPNELRTEALAQSDPFEGAGPQIGLRSKADVLARLEALRRDSNEPAIAGDQVAAIGALLDVASKMPQAVDALAEIAKTLPAIAGSVDKLRTRMAALRARGVDVDQLHFETSYGRTQMEYYDGFVFGFYANDDSRLPPIATGGRYDALTRQLGRGQSIPAVGGVIRPDLLIRLEAQS